MGRHNCWSLANSCRCWAEGQKHCGIRTWKQLDRNRTGITQGLSDDKIHLSGNVCVGFFPDVPPRLIQAVDSAIEDCFLRPVVEVQTNNEHFTLRNIGESTAFKTELRFRDRNGTRIAPNKVIASLTPWSEYRDRLPPGTSNVDIKFAPERYTVLDYQPPLKSEQLDVEASLDSRRFKNETLNGDVSNLKIMADKMAITRDESNNVSNASTSIHDTNGKAFAMTFDLSPRRCWFYGHNSVSLVGNGELTLTWSRQDHDAGI